MKKDKFHLIGRLILTVHLNKHLGVITDDIEYKFNEVSYNKKEKTRRNLHIDELEKQIKVLDLDDDDETPIHTFEKEHIASIICNGKEIWDNESQKITI
ncbi:MAG: hypothetical protein WCO66_04600 [Candidatus Absconditabacteria bacterium]